MILVHFVVSSARNFPNAAPETVPGSAPSSSKRFCTSGIFRMASTSPSSFARTGAGVFAGATSPNQAEASKPGTPDSATVGTSGRALARLRACDRDRVDVLALHLRQHRRDVVEHHGDMAGNQIVHRRRRALVGDVHDVDAGHALEQFAGEMIGRTVARRSEITACPALPWRARSVPSRS